MITQNRTWSIIFVFGLIMLSMACVFAPASGLKATPTPTSQSAFAATLLASNGTSTPTSGLQAGGGTGGNSSSGGSNSSSGGSKGGSSDSNSGSNGGTVSPTDPPPAPGGEPYVVKQIMSMGGEVISGAVCSLTKPFSVTSVTPKVTFVFLFTPLDAKQGKVTYQYAISSAGESHDASGVYSLSPVGSDGTLQLSLTVSDHVVFKGFDGNIPNQYKFNLVPSGNTSCPA